MNDVVVRPEYELPVTLEDLSRFVLIGREQLVAVRAEIRAIDKVGLAKSVREQKLAEAQAISEAVLDAEVRIGQLMRDVPKAQGLRTDLELHGPVQEILPERENFTTAESQGSNTDEVEVCGHVKAEPKTKADVI